MRFEHFSSLYLMVALAPLGLLFFVYLRWRKRVLIRLADARLHTAILPGFVPNRAIFRFGLFAVIGALLIVAYANPQTGKRTATAKRRGIDLIVSLDISQSMLAEDDKPSRLLRAKQVVSELTDKLAGDRFGLVVFAGNAYLQVPLTTDYAACKSILKTVTPDIAPTQGTAIGDAIDMAVEHFGESKGGRAILIISDGENHDGDAEESASKAASQGIMVLTAGTGTAAGAPIPLSNAQGDFKRDKNRSIVLSKFNETMLKGVAEAGKGSYFHLSGSAEDADIVIEEISSLEKSTHESRTYDEYDTWYQWVLGVAILLLMVEMMMPEKKKISTT